MQTNQAETRTSPGPVLIGAVLLALATAGIHLFLFLIEGTLTGNGEMLPIYQLLFINNIAIYASLAGALLAPIPLLAWVRPATRTMLTAVAVASIVSYYYVGVTDLLGNIDKIIEVLLIALLTVSAAVAGKEEFGGGRGFARGALVALVQLAVGVGLGIAMFFFLRPLLV